MKDVIERLDVFFRDSSAPCGVYPSGRVRVMLRDDVKALLSYTKRLERDALRYQCLRGDGTEPTAYAPEEAGVWGGEELDRLCDRWIKIQALSLIQQGE